MERTDVLASRRRPAAPPRPRSASRRRTGCARRERLPLAALAALALLLPAAAAPGATAAGSCPDEVERAVTELLNRERLAAGVPPLEVDVRLVAAASRHSEDMASGGFLSHTGSDGSTPAERVREAGYDAPAGEIAGYGYATPEAIVAAWMDSGAHRGILLREDHRHLGVGYAPGEGLLRHYYTANFGRDPLLPVSPETECEPPEPLGTPSCDDGVDADADGLVDHPEDPGCATPSQRWESNPWEGSPRCGLGFELALLLPPLLAARRLRRGGRTP